MHFNGLGDRRRLGEGCFLRPRLHFAIALDHVLAETLQEHLHALTMSSLLRPFFVAVRVIFFVVIEASKPPMFR